MYCSSRGVFLSLKGSRMFPNGYAEFKAPEIDPEQLKASPSPNIPYDYEMGFGTKWGTDLTLHEWKWGTVIQYCVAARYRE